PYLFLGLALLSLPAPASLVWALSLTARCQLSSLYCLQSLSHLLYCLQSLVIPVLSAVSWSSPVLSVSGLLYCLQSLVISCTMSAVSGHPCTVRSLWSSPVLSAVSGHPLYCPQSLVISCTVRSLWSSLVLCPQSLVKLLYCVCSLWSSP
ncbi:unnamed protein product, partial [Staurois parvus]